MKRLIPVILIIIAMLPLAGARIVILHTNDTRSAFDARDATFINPDFPPRLGGLYSLATCVEWEREKAEKRGDIFLLLDSGNFTIKLLDNNDIDMSGAVKAFNYMKYDAVNLGVDELYSGAKGICENIKAFDMPILLTNVSAKDCTSPAQRFIILEKQGIKIGLFGLTTQYALFNLRDEALDELKIQKEMNAAQEVVNILKSSQCDIIIGVTSIGYENDVRMAETIEGIDLILGGYEGRGMRTPIETSKNHTIVFKGYGELSSVEKIILDTDELGNVSGYSGESITLFEEAYPPDENLREIINSD